MQIRAYTEVHTPTDKTYMHSRSIPKNPYLNSVFKNNPYLKLSSPHLLMDLYALFN